MPQEVSDEPISAELGEWLERLKLTVYASTARAWCARMGAVSIKEVLENREEFANELQLKPLERKRIEKDYQSRFRGPAAAPPGSPAPGGGPVPVAAPPSPASNGQQVAPPAGPYMQPGGGYGPDVAAGPPRRHPHQNGTIGPEDDPKKYTLLEELGQGATATVYRCVDASNSYFACKTISLAKLKLQRDFQRIASKLQREVEILFSLRHPRIVRLFDIVEQNDKLHLIMELVEGCELFDRIVACGTLEEHVARYVFLQIAEGLKYIHSKDVVYRDLKPENILVDEKASREDFFEVKLSDFGHSKLINNGYSTALTRVGTPQYWAPEVNDPNKAAMGYDQRVDLWSLGVVLYVMLIGAYPFDGVGERMDDQIRRAHLTFRPGLSEQAQDLIRSLIRVDPEHRLPLHKVLQHPWVVSAGGRLGQLMKLCTEAGHNNAEEHIRLPMQPSKDQVNEIRKDLLTWMSKFKCFATVKDQEVVAALGGAAEVSEEMVTAARNELRQLVNYHCHSWKIDQVLILRVCENDGAGLDLQPEQGGMRIEKIYDRPGQPGLKPNDLITNINEVSLRGAPNRVERIFGAHFRDGVQITVRRDR